MPPIVYHRLYVRKKGTHASVFEGNLCPSWAEFKHPKHQSAHFQPNKCTGEASGPGFNCRYGLRFWVRLLHVSMLGSCRESSLDSSCTKVQRKLCSDETQPFCHQNGFKDVLTKTHLIANYCGYGSIFFHIFSIESPCSARPYWSLFPELRLLHTTCGWKKHWGLQEGLRLRRWKFHSPTRKKNRCLETHPLSWFVLWHIHNHQAYIVLYLHSYTYVCHTTENNRDQIISLISISVQYLNSKINAALQPNTAKKNDGGQNDNKQNYTSIDPKQKQSMLPRSHV